MLCIWNNKLTIGITNSFSIFHFKQFKQILIKFFYLFIEPFAYYFVLNIICRYNIYIHFFQMSYNYMDWRKYFHIIQSLTRNDTSEFESEKKKRGHKAPFNPW